MRINAGTVISTDRAQIRPSSSSSSSSITSPIVLPRVHLIPYVRDAVDLYHSWMSDPVLREATASEELTLAEEYAMQAKWQSDKDKLTFLIAVSDSQDSSGETDGHLFQHLVGDVNVFFDPVGQQEGEGAGEEAERDEETSWKRGQELDQRTASDGGTCVRVQLSDAARSFARQLGADSSPSSFPDEEAELMSRLSIDDENVDYSVGELSVQIADISARGSRVAVRAVLMMMEFVASELGTRRFIARISATNTASLAMFSRSLGFGFKRAGGKPNVFGEVELYRDLVEGSKWATGTISAGVDSRRAAFEEDLEKHVGPRKRTAFSCELEPALVASWRPDPTK